jgi:RNA polymerase sigma-70 factor (ECF subfamily)
MKASEPRSGGAQWIVSALTLYEGPLLRYAAKLLGDVDRARDVVQDTFLRLCREDPSALDGHLRQWLFAVCRNRVLDIHRKEGRVQPLDEKSLEAQPSPLPGPARVLERRDDLQAVLRTMATLPASQQEVLRLKFQAGLSYQEIAEVTGRSVSHVGVLLHDGLKSIRERVR